MAVHAAAVILELRIPGSQSLKEKRTVLGPLVAALRNDLPIAVAEAEHQNTWQLSTLVAAVVGADSATLESIIASTVDLVDRRIDVEVVATSVSYVEDPRG